MKRNRSDLLTPHLLAGAAAGFFAAWTMNEFQSAWSKITESAQGKQKSQSSQLESGESEDATVKAANRIAEAVLGRELSKEEKKVAGPIVHYAFGATWGAIYSALADETNLVTRGFGMIYATAVFVIVDEIAAPALKLSKPPKEYPVSSHLYGWASHLVYGISLELARRGVESVSPQRTKEKPRRRLLRAA
jgi:Protein of unknown function (DUF1440)